MSSPAIDLESGSVGKDVHRHHVDASWADGLSQQGEDELKALAVVNPKIRGQPDYQGLSVHYLRHCFLDEVRAAGFSRDSKIYDLEDLRGPPGLVRKKGAETICPMTGKKGAAYVHCVKGQDNVGDATHMLSYTWG